MYELLEEYSKSRRQDTAETLRIPEDPDGLYLLIDGIFTVKNEYNFQTGGMNKPLDLVKQTPDVGKSPMKVLKESEKIASRPELMDLVGAEKYL